MAKEKITYYCKECGQESIKWMGKCPGCGVFNSFVESPAESINSASNEFPTYKASSFSWTSSEVMVRLSEATSEEYIRHSTGMKELDIIFGGGIVEGSVTLLGGEPGIGKSTLLLELCNRYEDIGDILYVSGEESPSQIALRALRLNINSDRIIILSQTSFEDIASKLKETKPKLMIIDSIQTLYSKTVSGTPGSLSQAREVTSGLIRIAKSNNLPVILIGHVTKDGNIAGPKTLEHMVDTVLYFEGDGTSGYRILRSVKNRFGKSNELSFFEMRSDGLLPIDGEEALLSLGRPISAPGSSLTSIMEGSRALLIEIQALINRSCYATPQRMISGPDRNRVAMLLAVADKEFNLGLSDYDCFVNVIGGVKVTDPASDLAIVSSIISSSKNIPIKNNTLLLGEVGLTGELRPVSYVASRLNEGVKAGITRAVLPTSSKKALEGISFDGIELFFVDNLKEAVDILYE